MKRTLISGVAFVGLFFAVTVTGNAPARGDDSDRGRHDREDEDQLEVQIGFDISPIPLSSLDLKGKDPELVGLGSYIVNAQASCNDCHTCPSYATGHNPYPPVLGDGKFNSVNYMAGGVPFGPVISRNITPDATGKPAGLNLQQFETAIRTGHDPLSGDILEVMPWPVLRFMTGRDLDAIYSYLSAIPSATPGSCTGAGQ